MWDCQMGFRGLVEVRVRFNPLSKNVRLSVLGRGKGFTGFGFWVWLWREKWIASRQLVEIDKVIKGFKLEIEGHVFNIDLIPFGHGSFDMIIERPEEKARLLMSAKASDKKQEEIIMVRDFPEVFPNDLSRLPPLWEIEFRIELILEAVPNCKSIPLSFGILKLEVLSGLAGYYLALPVGSEGLCMVYGDALGDMTWLCINCKEANVVSDALSRKEKVKPKRVRDMNMTLQSSIKDRILAAHKEAMDESLKGDGRNPADTWMEAHKLKYLYYPGADNDVKAEHQRPIWSLLLQLCEIPVWNMGRNSYGFCDIFHIEVLAVNARGIRESFRHEYGISPSDRWSESSITIKTLDDNALSIALGL
ncbi:hypothetical protein Tco_0882273 [Tanacetum coccineum]